MADEYAFRDFVGNLYPPPSAKGLMDVPAQTAATSVAAAPVDAPPPEGVSSAAATKAKGIYRVVDRPDGTRRMYYSGPDGKTIDRGAVIAPTETLNTVGKYSAQGKVWDIPEEYAKKFERGNPGFLEHIANSFNGAEAGMHAGLVGYLAITKQMPYDEAIDRTDPDLVKAQLTDLPQAAWGDNRLQKIVGASKWALGAAAEVLPSLIGGAQAGMAEAPKVALAATGVAAMGGPAGLAALATPPAILTVAGMSWKYGAFDFTSKVTTGSLALEMKRKGLDDKTIETVAPIAGMFAGALEILHVKYLPAPFRRALAAKVFNNAAAKKAMTHWLTNYFKETGAEVSVEVAQQYIEGFATNIMASMDERPDVAKSWASMNTEAGKVALKTAVGMGLIKAPGAAFEAFSAPGAKAAPTKKAAVAEGADIELPADKMNETLAAAPKAPAIEQELVKDSPEVAAALSELNAELDPTAEDAEMAYSFIGEEMAGDENVDAAVTAKVEALRSEMRDILSEDANTPEEQNRVIDIQREIGLLEGMQEKMGAPTVSETTAAPVAEKKPITGAKARVQKQIVAAREKKLVTDLNNTLAMVKELENSRTRLEKAGRPVVSINTQIAKLMGEVYKIDEQRNRLTETGEVGAGEKLELKPATLESIQKTAFTEGRKEVTTRRAELIASVAEQYSLTDRDIKALTKTRNLGVMSDLDFKVFLDDLRVRAKVLAEKKQAYFELETTKQMGEFKKADNLRKALALPPVSKMTAAEMKQYATALEEYETGDEFLSAKRAEALINTPWEGVNTVREAIDRLAFEFGTTPEALEAVKSSWTDRFRYAPELARQNPLYDYVVRRVIAADIEGVSKFFEEDVEFEKLAKAALASRKTEGVVESLMEAAAPQQKVIRQYMEAEDAAAKAAIAATMTPEEVAFADHEAAFLLRAYNYLLANNDLESSRFVDTYVAYTKKPVSEILRGVVSGETEFKQALSDILDSWKSEEMRFRAMDDKGTQLGYKKFFSHALYRSGEMAPSENIVRASRNYRRQFFRKQALDKMIPTVDTAIAALEASQKTEDGKLMMKATHDFIKAYLNAQKGKVEFGWVPQGTLADALIRASTQAVSLMYMGGNLTLQIASEVGATIPKMPLLGVTGYAKAKYRKRTLQGKAILAKYKGFVGEGPIADIARAGANIEERILPTAFALFAWSRKTMLEDVLLGSMTDAEFKAGEVDLTRLSDIKLEASKWIDVGGTKSIFGKSSIGTAQMQYKSWAVPTTISLIRLAEKLAKSLAGKATLTPKDKLEIIRVAYTASAVTVAGLMFDDLKDEDSFLGRLAARVYMELTGSLTAGLKPSFFLTGPAAVAWVARLLENLYMLATLQKLKIGRNKGKLAGAEGLKRQLTPAIIRQFVSKGDKKPKGPPKGPPKPVKYKRPED